MPVLKVPPKHTRSATIQVRVEEEISSKLRRYAEFIDSTPAYVVSEALKLLFNKDSEFRQWLTQSSEGQAERQAPEAPVAAYRPAKRSAIERPSFSHDAGSSTK